MLFVVFDYVNYYNIWTTFFITLFCDTITSRTLFILLYVNYLILGFGQLTNMGYIPALSLEPVPLQRREFPPKLYLYGYSNQPTVDRSVEFLQLGAYVYVEATQAHAGIQRLKPHL